MKKLIAFVMLASVLGAADAPKKPVAKEVPAALAAELPAPEPTAEQKEIASLKEQVAQLQKIVAVLKQQRDAMAAQVLDVQAAQQLQGEKK